MNVKLLDKIKNDPEVKKLIEKINLQMGKNKKNEKRLVEIKRELQNIAQEIQDFVK